MADDNVVNLPVRKKLVWVCRCGCKTFYLMDDGSADCANCAASSNTLEDVPPGVWVNQLPDAPNDTEVNDGGTYIIRDLGTVDLAIQRSISHITKAQKSGTLEFVASYDRTGFGQHWFAITDEEHKAKAIDRLEQLLIYVKATEAPK